MDFSNYSMMLLCDFYKISHREQYPEGTETVYSTWTPRKSMKKDFDHVVAFGFQYFVRKYLVKWFNAYFFKKPQKQILNEYRAIIKQSFGDPDPDVQHIIDLHDLGYLPLHIKAMPEGTKVPMRVPMLTIHNTHPKFAWLTNYIETLASTSLWLPCTSATTAAKFRETLDHFAELTGGDKEFVKFQGHDFSMRGHTSLESGAISGAAHLLSFAGTDTIPAIYTLNRYYAAKSEANKIVGTSVPATEHSVMCAHGQDELQSYCHLLTKVYPSGVISIVSDTWDFWNVVTNVIGSEWMKRHILQRDGKVVIRPDSGDPVKIMCGDPDADNLAARRGLVRVLWDIFGGTVNEKGYRELDPHIGAIYGDSITLERCQQICGNLLIDGFASTNVVFGIGSYTYQHVTRDTFGFAMKSTLCVINGEEKFIFKDPKTDDGTKKSQKGAVVVQIDEHGRIYYQDELPLKNKEPNLLKTIFYNGQVRLREELYHIRRKMHGSSF